MLCEWQPSCLLTHNAALSSTLMWLSFHLPLCYTEEHKLTWPDRKKNLYLTLTSENVILHTIFSEETKHIPCLFPCPEVQSVSSVSHMDEWRCINVTFWLCGSQSVSRTLEPLERKFRNLKCLKCPHLKLFTELAWLKRQKVFRECQ